MYHSDPNINIAIERAADRLNAIRLYGQAHAPAPATPLDAAEDTGSSRQPAIKFGATVVVIGLMVLALLVVAF